MPKIKPKPQSIKFHYEKSNLFRVIHADGVHGGISPQLNIHMAFFNERQPIPQQTTHLVEGGILGSEDRDARMQKEGIFREIEADVIMSLGVAKEIAKWLTDKVNEVETFIVAQDKSR